MHATQPYADLRNKKRKALSLLLSLEDMISQQLILFFRNFDIEKRILEFVHDLIPHNMWLGVKEVAFSFWLVDEEVVESDEHVEIACSASVGWGVESAFGWVGGIAYEGWELDVFEEFFEELYEEGVDLGLIGVDDV